MVGFLEKPAILFAMFFEFGITTFFKNLGHSGQGQTTSLPTKFGRV
jgi:hypothetical protein